MFSRVRPKIRIGSLLLVQGVDEGRSGRTATPRRLAALSAKSPSASEVPIRPFFTLAEQVTLQQGGERVVEPDEQRLGDLLAGLDEPVPHADDPVDELPLCRAEVFHRLGELVHRVVAAAAMAGVLARLASPRPRWASATACWASAIRSALSSATRASSRRASARSRAASASRSWASARLLARVDHRVGALDAGLGGLALLPVGVLAGVLGLAQVQLGLLEGQLRLVAGPVVRGQLGDLQQRRVGVLQVQRRPALGQRRVLGRERDVLQLLHPLLARRVQRALRRDGLALGVGQLLLGVARSDGPRPRRRGRRPGRRPPGRPWRPGRRAPPPAVAVPDPAGGLARRRRRRRCRGVEPGPERLADALAWREPRTPPTWASPISPLAMTASAGAAAAAFAPTAKMPCAAADRPPASPASAVPPNAAVL